MSVNRRTDRWQSVLDEDENGFFGWKPYPSSNDVYELPNAEVCWHKVPRQLKPYQSI